LLARRPLTLALAIVALGGIAASCDHGTGGTVSATHASLPVCADDPSWRCGSLSVPLDRANPGAGSIRIAFYLLPHTGPGRALEPIFITPGGPGESGWSERFFYEKAPQLSAQHDLVLIDPRGTGRSGAIDCADLQNGFQDDAAFHAAVASCGRQLGAAADRYGSGDVALDVEDVRRALGYDLIDYYAFSYGSVSEQGYAARFPKHVHALAFDAGLVASDPSQSYAWGLGGPQALVRIERLLCRRDPSCHGDVAAAIGKVAARLRLHPVRARHIVVDEVELINLLSHGGDQGTMAPPETVLQIAEALRLGNPRPLLSLARQRPFWSSRMGPVSEFSEGDNIAALCSDLPTPWRPADSIAVRRRRYAAALAAFPKRTFAPFSANGWNGFNLSEACLTWPAPHRYESVVPTPGPLRNLPTIIFSGDVDGTVPTEMARHLLAEFPHAAFITVAGAAHPAIGWRPDCVPGIAAHFFATLGPGNTSCARSLT
jgi:pimeloyl-ACP methyl ester carboxylesterase